MVDQILNLKFGISTLISFTLLYLIGWSAKYFYKNAGTRTFSPDFVKEPTSNSLTIIGLLIPILVGVSSFFYINQPSGDYAFIWVGIFLFLITLLTAIWISFSVLRLVNSQNTITLNFPQDIRYIVALGIMYGSLIVGLIFVVIFFLFDLPSNSKTPDTIAQNSSTIYLSHPKVDVNLTKNEVETLWGVPDEVQNQGTMWKYQGLESIFYLEFDSSGSLSRIVEERK